MSSFVARLLYWSPRILATCFVALVILFSLDESGECFGESALLPPMGALLSATGITLALIITWRREWIGTVTFSLLAALTAWAELTESSPSWAMLIIPLTLLVIAALFLANWVKRAGVRAALHIGPAIVPLLLHEPEAPNMRP